jgi:hypothetical protein
LISNRQRVLKNGLNVVVFDKGISENCFAKMNFSGIKRMQERKEANTGGFFHFE